MKKILTIILLGAALLTVGCTYDRTTSYVKMDRTDKSITMPSGGGLLTTIKKNLLKTGWSIKVDSDSLQTKGVSGSKVNLTEKIVSDTKYRMNVAIKKEICFSCDCVRAYEISLIDNKSGREVITFDKSSYIQGFCYQEVADEVTDWMNK